MTSLVKSKLKLIRTATMRTRDKSFFAPYSVIPRIVDMAMKVKNPMKKDVNNEYGMKLMAKRGS